MPLPRPAGAVLLLSSAVVLYALAAWSVAPGFYDGIAPNQPYNWLSPPPQEAAGNKQPQGMQQVVQPGKGAGIATPDGQAQLNANAGAFPPGQTVTVDIQPTASFPAPNGFVPATNVYRITASAAPVAQVTVYLRYSTQVAAPDTLYVAADASGPWTPLGTSGTGQPYFISAPTTQLGYFVAGRKAAGGSGSGPAPSDPTPLMVVAIASIALVVLSGVPLLLSRRNARGRASKRFRRQPEGATPALR